MPSQPFLARPWSSDGAAVGRFRTASFPRDETGGVGKPPSDDAGAKPRAGAGP